MQKITMKSKYLKFVKLFMLYKNKSYTSVGKLGRLNLDISKEKSYFTLVTKSYRLKHGRECCDALARDLYIECARS